MRPVLRVGAVSQGKKGPHPRSWRSPGWINWEFGEGIPSPTKGAGIGNAQPGEKGWLVVYI